MRNLKQCLQQEAIVLHTIPATETSLATSASSSRVRFQTCNERLAEPSAQRMDQADASVIVTRVPATLGFIQRHQQQSIQFAWVARPGKEGKKISHHQKETVWTTPEKVNTIHSNPCRLAMTHQRQRCLYLSHSEWGNCSTLQLHSQGVRQHLRLPRTKQGLKMCAESPQVRNRVRRVRFEVGPEVRR